MTTAPDLSDEHWEHLQALIGPLHLPTQYVPVEPTAKQEWFLRRDEREAFFGGAAGPGKSWCLLMGALQYADVDGYDALLLRPTLTEFERPGGLIEVSHDWLNGTDAWWNGTRRQWSFPSGATLTFGYLNRLGHMRQWKGTAFSFCGFDELTGFEERLYRAMFRVLRQPTAAVAPQLAHVPVRMRGASNPGDRGHEWVKDRFVDPSSRRAGAVYVPALIVDNPFLDYATYIETLAELSPVDRERLIRGDWDVMEEGGKFQRADFIQVDTWDEPAVKTVRYWDLAATELSEVNTDPDWTVGLRLEKSASGLFCIRSIVRGRWSAAEVELRVKETAKADGRGVEIRIEQEPGASGKSLISYYKRSVLAGYPVYSGLPRGDKEVRARPVAAATSNGLVRVVKGKNVRELLDEAAMFPEGQHDDIVDALSGAHRFVTAPGTTGKSKATRARGRIPGVTNRSTAGGTRR